MCIKWKARYFFICMIFIIFSESKFQKVSKEESIFNGWSKDDLKSILLQTPQPKPPFYNDSKYLESNVIIPQSFDSRLTWPNCPFLIKDQGKCGSCWSFASSEMLSDRFCISNYTNIQLSAQDAVSCNSYNQGCSGGTVPYTYNYLESTGIVSESCFPYTSGFNGIVPKCHESCASSELFVKYTCQDGSFSYFMIFTVIQQEILINGPVTAYMNVYDDFMDYKSGIYERESSDFLGGHLVKIIGWDIDQEQSKYYWIVANSWGENWGMGGFFNIYIDQCQISSLIASCTPGNKYVPPHHTNITLYIVLGIIIICVAIGVFLLVRHLKKNRPIAGYTPTQTLMNH